MSRKGTCCPQAFTTNVVNLDHLAEVVFLSSVKILYSPPSILFSLGGSHCTQSIFEGWGLWLHLLDLLKLFVVFFFYEKFSCSSFIYLFNHFYQFTLWIFIFLGFYTLGYDLKFMLLTLLFSMFQLWPLGAFSVDSCPL